MILTHMQTAIYYDCPQVILAEDNTTPETNKYIGVYTNSKDLDKQYLFWQIDYNLYKQFLNSEMCLRQLIDSSYMSADRYSSSTLGIIDIDIDEEDYFCNIETDSDFINSCLPEYGLYMNTKGIKNDI